ncbi:unnamed protein product, partial [Effrenium voratum]
MPLPRVPSEGRPWEERGAPVPDRRTERPNWAPTSCEHHGGQRYRRRAFVKVEKWGGKPCEPSALIQVEPCGDVIDKPVDCAFAAWGEWSECANNMAERARSVETNAQFGGMLCHGPLKEVRTCSGKAEQSVLQKPCKLDEWSIWAPCANNVQQRTRQVEEDAGPEGEPCSGVVREVRSCQEPIDCKVSAWTAWDACDRDCGVGQSQRHRQVTQNPMYHGQPCPISLVEAKSCIVKTCKAEDAQVGAWTSWSSCTSSCGIGHKVRERQVTSSQEGAGFSGALKEASSCGE